MSERQVWADEVERPPHYRHIQGEMIRRIGARRQDAEISDLAWENQMLRDLLAWYKQRDENQPKAMAAGGAK